MHVVLSNMKIIERRLLMEEINNFIKTIMENDRIKEAEADAKADFFRSVEATRDAEDPETAAAFESASQFIGCLGKLAPRLYSIASSPDAVPGQVSLCVGAVRYTPKHSDRPRGGVCSTYLADRVKPGDKVRVFVQPKPGFRLPDDPATPVIMVGPGAGIAPFRAFWQQRTIDKAEGGMWFFFGNPHQATDACYEDEINELVAAGNGLFKYLDSFGVLKPYELGVHDDHAVLLLFRNRDGYATPARKSQAIDKPIITSGTVRRNSECHQVGRRISPFCA